MNWTLEAMGGTGSKNRVTIHTLPYEGGPTRKALITVDPKGGSDRPTLPFLPVGTPYRDRNGIIYRITVAGVVEHGYDGDGSHWSYEYTAEFGVVETGVAP